MAFTDIWKVDPMPAGGAVIRGESWRVTVLTDKPTEVQVSVAANGIVLRKIAGTVILLR